MEAAPRPPLEPLADLPVEEPLDVAARRKEPQAAAAAPLAAQAAPAAPAASSASKSPEQTGLNFVDPEMFLATGVLPTAVTVTPAAKEPDPPLALELEDPVVDEILTAAPPPAPPPPAAEPSKPPLSLTPDSPAAAKSAPATEERSTRVPIAKTASLSAAATKLAAASSQRTVSKSSKPPAAAPEAPVAHPAAKEMPSKPAPAKPVPPKELSVRETPASELAARQVVAKEAAAKEMPASAASPAKPAATNGKLDAPSLASWASARAAATPSSKPSSAAAKPAATAAAAPAPAPAPAVRAVPKPAAPAPTAAPAPAAAAAAAAPMDRDFIARNQVVERYMSGRLPLKGATDFERFCHDHPQMLDEIGLPERVNAGLRLLEAAGKPEPWQEAPRPAWQKPPVTLALAAAAAVFGIALAGVVGHSASKSHRIAELEKRLTEQALDAATSTRSIRLMPSRSGASNAPAITIGGGKAELADIKIDESRSAYHVFRITIDRIDQGRVGVISNLAKDSNGHLRIALNSSALGPGNYQLTLEGLDWRGEPQPDSWVTIGVAR